MVQAGQPLIVVSNTSPLTNLAAIGQFDLLRLLFGRVHIPRGVEAELSSGEKQWPGAAEVAQSSWIAVHAVADRHIVNALRLDLDLGEAETISLALLLRADIVLLDEQAGRRAAHHLGLNIMGVVGLLVRAKQRGLISAVQPLLHALQQQAGFYLSQSVVEHALELAGERQDASSLNP